jgi:hypothetical protein
MCQGLFLAAEKSNMMIRMCSLHCLLRFVLFARVMGKTWCFIVSDL